MHELALAQDIIETISTKVTRDLQKVSKINIEVGAFSGIVMDSLDFGLQAILMDKNVPDVKINIIEVPTAARCECGNEYRLREIFETCPLCRSFNRKLISGMDIIIKSVEILEE